MPVARHFVDAAAAVRRTCAGIGCIRVHAEVASENDWPVIIIELVREEERAGEAVIFRTMVAVVLVRGDGVASEAVVLRGIYRQFVVVAQKDRLTVTALNQVWRNGAVEGPH